MNKEEFIKLKVGDKIRYGDHEFHVYMIEKAIWPETGEEGTFKVYNNQFQSVKLIDDIVDKLVLVSEPVAKHMVRIELVVTGVDVKTKGWGFMEDAIESAVESYGGEITEFSVASQ